MPHSGLGTYFADLLNLALKKLEKSADNKNGDKHLPLKNGLACHDPIGISIEEKAILKSVISCNGLGRHPFLTGRSLLIKGGG